MKTNFIHYGDNLKFMKSLEGGKVDLIYIDPPFFTGRDFSTFCDKWESMELYVQYMTLRVKEMYRVLKGTGSIFLHCDSHASHHLRVMLDNVFGYKNFINEIVWNKGFVGTCSKKFFQRTHDLIFFYGKDKKITRWNNIYQEYKDSTINRKNKIDKNGIRYQFVKRRRTNGEVYYGKAYRTRKQHDDVINIPIMSSTSKERIGYDTQKPMSLLKKIITCSTNKCDIVADFFCGSGTTLVAAKQLGRHFIGCDISRDAISISNKRMAKKLYMKNALT